MSIFETSLPNGWTWETVEQHYGITKKPQDIDFAAHERIPFVSMDGVPSNGRTALRYQQRPTKEITSGIYFERGDILLSKITPSFENGKQGKADDFPGAFGYASTEVIPIHPRRDADGLYLFYYFLHPEVREHLAAAMEGSTGRQRVPERAVRTLRMPYAPPAEQRQISTALRHVQAGVEIQATAVTTARELKQAAMSALFDRGWPQSQLGALGKIGNGSTPKRTRPEYWTGGTLPWLTSGKIHERVVTAADEFVTPLAADECHLPRVRAGSLLVAITGQGKTLGNVAMTTIDTFVSQHLAYLTIDRDDVDPNFVRHYLSSRYDDLRALGQAGGSTKGAITCAGLKTVRVPLPALDEQREIARTLDTIDRKIALHERKRATLQELFDTLLHDLMTGRLRVDAIAPDALAVA